MRMACIFPFSLSLHSWQRKRKGVEESILFPLLTIIHGTAIIAATINRDRRSATVRRDLLLWGSLNTF